MSVSLAVTIIVLLSVALIGGLAYVVSLARHLTPHVPCATASISPAEKPSLHVSRLPRRPGRDAEPMPTAGAAAGRVRHQASVPPRPAEAIPPQSRRQSMPASSQLSAAASADERAS